MIQNILQGIGLGPKRSAHNGLMAYNAFLKCFTQVCFVIIILKIYQLCQIKVIFCLYDVDIGTHHLPPGSHVSSVTAPLSRPVTAATRSQVEMAGEG